MKIMKEKHDILSLVLIILWLTIGTAISENFDIRSGESPSPLNVSLNLSKAPLSNESIIVTCKIISNVDAKNVTANIILPPDALLAGGNLSWKGELNANRPAIFNASIRFAGAGAFLLEAVVWKILDPEKEAYWESKDVIYVTIREPQEISSKYNEAPLKETEVVKRLEWRGPVSPGNYSDYIMSENFRTGLKAAPIVPIQATPYPSVRAPPRFIILTRTQSLASSLTPEIARYIEDAKSQGYNAESWFYSDGLNPSPSDVRSWLSSQMPIAGALLIGDIPTAWFEQDGEEWPIDLYYMDLDGTWSDANSNEIFDSHSGDKAPEIFVARLKADNLDLDGSTEVNLLRNYFNKDHKYRQGLLSQTKRGLMYIDDDWVGSSTDWNSALGLVYDTTTLVNDKATTNPTDYQNRLTQSYDWVQICCHGWSGGQQFKINDAWDGSMYSSTIKTLDPMAIFYNLFICSSCRFTDADYYGGWHIFTNTNGLVVVGSTKSGSMLYFDDFYRPIAQGENIGTAFAKWYTEKGLTDISWFYGMCILGDPLLTPLKYGTPIKIALRAANGQYVCAENGGGSYLVANRNSVGAWETFQRIDLGNGKVALRAANGQYVCAENGGGTYLVANRNAIGAWETFTYMDLGNSKIGLKASNGQVVCAENGGGDGVYANRPWVGDWESFTLEYH
ncbi:MAG: C25 family cysteine peptidase [Methanothrix sp.]|nr:C25 family cysteine peptidase [Methanothrix sp.]